MSFADALQRLRDAAQVIQTNDKQMGMGKRRIVEQKDLAELLRHFDRLDAEARRVYEATQANPLSSTVRNARKEYNTWTDERKSAVQLQGGAAPQPAKQVVGVVNAYEVKIAALESEITRLENELNDAVTRHWDIT